MSDYLVRQIRRMPNVEVRLGAEVVGGEGTQRLERLAIRDNAWNTVENVPATMLFVMIGALPRTDWLAGVVQRDDNGFIVTGHDISSSEWPLERLPMTFEASTPGVFVVGDGRHGSTKRVASAMGEGAGAVQNVHRYLEELARADADNASRSLATGTWAAAQMDGQVGRDPDPVDNPLHVLALGQPPAVFATF